MKKLMVLSLVLSVSVPVFAASTATTTTRTYDAETSSSPIYSRDNEVMDTRVEPTYNNQWEQERMENQRMEETRRADRFDRYDRFDSARDDGIDYNDRTRTNRERHALNTSSHASDDQ